MISKATQAKLVANNIEWQSVMKELAVCPPFREVAVTNELTRLNRERDDILAEV